MSATGHTTSISHDIQTDMYNKCAPCKPGTEYKKNGCTDCKKGQSTQMHGKSDAKIQGGKCKPCAKGYFQNNTGRAICKKCPRGKYQDVKGRSSCKLCPTGTYQDDKGTKKKSDCKKCPIGKYQNKEGQKSCIKCKEKAKEYQDKTGGTTCKKCKTGLSTGKKCLNGRKVYLKEKIVTAGKDEAWWQDGRQPKFKCHCCSFFEFD